MGTTTSSAAAPLTQTATLKKGEEMQSLKPLIERLLLNAQDVVLEWLAPLTPAEIAAFFPDCIPHG